MADDCGVSALQSSREFGGNYRQCDRSPRTLSVSIRSLHSRFDNRWTKPPEDWKTACDFTSCVESDRYCGSLDLLVYARSALDFAFRALSRLASEPSLFAMMAKIL